MQRGDDMDQGFMVTVRKLAIPFMLVALVIGIGLGLLLAWQVWPVQWYDTDPSDLRVGHQKEYVVMVANSFLVTGDADAARTQLYALTDDDTSWAQVVDFVGQVAVEHEMAGDEATTKRIGRMEQALNLSDTPPEAFQQPKRVLLSPPKWVVLLLASVAFVLGLAGLVWFGFRLIKQRSQGKAEIVGEQVVPEPSFETLAEPAAESAPWGEPEMQELVAEPLSQEPELEPAPLQEPAGLIFEEAAPSSRLTPTVVSALDEPEEEIALEEVLQPHVESEITCEEEAQPQVEPEAEPEIAPEAVLDHIEPSPPPCSITLSPAHPHPPTWGRWPSLRPDTNSAMMILMPTLASNPRGNSLANAVWTSAMC